MPGVQWEVDCLVHEEVVVGGEGGDYAEGVGGGVEDRQELD